VLPEPAFFLLWRARFYQRRAGAHASWMFQHDFLQLQDELRQVTNGSNLPQQSQAALSSRHMPSWGWPPRNIVGTFACRVCTRLILECVQFLIKTSPPGKGSGETSQGYPPPVRQARRAGNHVPAQVPRFSLVRRCPTRIRSPPPPIVEACNSGMRSLGIVTKVTRRIFRMA